MKKIINGKKYDTETAPVVAAYEYSYKSEYDWYREELHKKRTDEFFLYGKGGAGSIYAECISNHEYGPGEEIRPLTPEEAQNWAMERIDVDEYEKIFGEVEE